MQTGTRTHSHGRRCRVLFSQREAIPLAVSWQSWCHPEARCRLKEPEPHESCDRAHIERHACYWLGGWHLKLLVIKTMESELPACSYPFMSSAPGAFRFSLTFLLAARSDLQWWRSAGRRGSTLHLDWHNFKNSGGSNWNVKKYTE